MESIPDFVKSFEEIHFLRNYILPFEGTHFVYHLNVTYIEAVDFLFPL